MNPMIRPYRPDDRAYITSTFLRSFVATKPLVVGMEVPSAFIYEGEGAALSILLDTSAEVDVAVAPDDDDAIMGYSVRHGDCLDYVYVAREFRKSGIAKMLMRRLSPETIQFYSHITPEGRRLLRYLPGAALNPYRFWGVQ